ncbi:MAG: AraC family transcriptional regulator [Burkholderiaceae bacterium]|nr:AraC family transcriptional regulator [Burkholderiaceae bacterium]
MTHFFMQTGPILLLLQSAKKLGFDAARIKAEIGPLPDDPSALISIDKSRRFWEVIQELHRVPCLPAMLAKEIPFGSYGPLDYFFCTSNSVGDFLHSYASYIPKLYGAVIVEIVEESELVWVRLKLAEKDIPPIVAESIVSGLMVRLRFALDREVAFERVLLPTNCVEHVATYKEFFGENLTFSAPYAALGLSKELWHTSLGRTDPFLHKIVENVAGISSEKSAVSLDVISAIRAELRKYFKSSLASAMPDVCPSFIAKSLKMSERTLQRRLAESGQTISAVVDEAKYEEAIRLLSLGEFSLMQIATHLRYADQASFSRAFKRWAGQTPADWKKTRSVKKK